MPERWRWRGDKKDMYQIEHNEFFRSIREGNPINDGDRMAPPDQAAREGGAHPAAAENDDVHGLEH